MWVLQRVIFLHPLDCANMQWGQGTCNNFCGPSKCEDIWLPGERLIQLHLLFLSFRSETHFLTKAGDIGREKIFTYLRQWLMGFVNRLRPREHGYGNIYAFYLYPEHVPRSLCWKHWEYNSQIPGDIQVECVICWTKLNSMFIPTADIVEDISLTNVRRTAPVTIPISS